MMFIYTTIGPSEDSPKSEDHAIPKQFSSTFQFSPSSEPRKQSKVTTFVKTERIENAVVVPGGGIRALT